MCELSNIVYGGRVAGMAGHDLASGIWQDAKISPTMLYCEIDTFVSVLETRKPANIAGFHDLKICYLLHCIHVLNTESERIGCQFLLFFLKHC